MENKAEKVQISKMLLNEIIETIEHYEEIIDGEWGSCRSAKRLIEDDCMTDLYKELITLRDKS